MQFSLLRESDPLRSRFTTCLIAGPVWFLYSTFNYLSLPVRSYNTYMISTLEEVDCPLNPDPLLTSSSFIFLCSARDLVRLPPFASLFLYCQIRFGISLSF